MDCDSAPRRVRWVGDTPWWETSTLMPEEKVLGRQL